MARLREGLEPTVSQDRIDSVLSQIKKIQTKLDQGKDASGLVEAFNRFTGRIYQLEDFQSFWKAKSCEEFARVAAQALPQKVDDISTAELVEIVNRIRNADENLDFYLAVLKANLPHPRVSDLIFWPKNEGLSEDVSAEDIVQKAMSYRPIQL